jgi:hypothetical protein
MDDFIYPKPFRPRLWHLLLMAVGIAAIGFVTSSDQTAHVGRRRPECINHLHFLGGVFGIYVGQHGELPPAVIRGDSPPRSWRVEVLPEMEQVNLRAIYHDDQLWNAESNRSAAKTAPRFSQCPVALRTNDDQGRQYTSYAAVTGSHTAFSDEGRKDFPKGIRDGTTQTAIVVEASGQDIVWTEPRDVNVDLQPIEITDGSRPREVPPGLISSDHVGGANMHFAGGNSRFVSSKIDRKVLKALLTIDGGENISDADF